MKAPTWTPIGSNGVSSGTGRRRCGGSSGADRARCNRATRPCARHRSPGAAPRAWWAPAGWRPATRSGRRQRRRARALPFAAGLVLALCPCPCLWPCACRRSRSRWCRRRTPAGRWRWSSPACAWHCASRRALEARRVSRIAVELADAAASSLLSRHGAARAAGTPRSAAPARSARARGERRRRGTPLPPVPTVRASRLMPAPRVPRNVFRISPFRRYPQRSAARPPVRRSVAPERFG